MSVSVWPSVVAPEIVGGELSTGAGCGPVEAVTIAVGADSAEYPDGEAVSSTLKVCSTSAAVGV